MLIDWLVFLAVSMTGLGSPIGKCDPKDGPKLEWSKADRQEAREEVLEYLKRKGATPVFLAYVDAVGERETNWTPSRWHDDGTGLGMHGLNVSYYGSMVSNLCDPRQSADVVQHIARRAIVAYGAESAWDIQAVFAGRHECVTGKGACTGGMQDRTTNATCVYMAARGFDCFAPISVADLGHE